MRGSTPHDNDAGLIAVRKNALTDNFVCLYDGVEAELDTQGGKYSMVCWAHSECIAHTNKRDALWFIRNPAEWCEGCMALEKSQNG